MATKNHVVDRDARITHSPSNLGAGACDHLDVGTYSGYDYESWLAFIGESWSGIPSASSITNATLYLYASGEYHIARTAGTIRVRRTSSLGVTFTEGTASHPMSGSNSITGANDPTVTATNEATASISDSNGWKTVTITDIVKDYFGQANYALQLHANSGVYEFAAREAGANDAYIVITYNANSVPNAATIVSPTGGALVSSQTPDLTFKHTDPDSDTATAYQVQVDNNSDFSSVTWDSGELTSAPPAHNANKTVTVGTSLARGTTYYWRARTKDAGGWGAWSGTTAQFKVMQLPTATITTPADNHMARLYMNAGGGLDPRFEVVWSFNCPDGHSQTSAKVRVYAETPGSPLHTHNHSGTAVTAKLSGYQPTRGTRYNLTIQPTCSGGLEGAETSTTANTCKVDWSRASYFYNMGATGPVSWGTPTVSATSTSISANVVEWSASTSTTEPTTWYSSLAGAPLPAGANNYVWHRVTQLAWGSGAPTKPFVSEVIPRWNTVALQADNWTTSAAFVVDPGIEKFGTQSMKGTSDTTLRSIYQLVDLTPDTDYAVSGYIRALGNPQASIRVAEDDGSAVIVSTTAVAATQDWTRTSVTFNSGARTQVRIQCALLAGGTNGDIAWFDALKAEASTIVTPWTPGFVGGGVALDAGGVQVDATAGGVFRLRGSTGGSRDTVALGEDGLLFGGDLHLHGGVAGEMRLESTTAGTSNPIFRAMSSTSPGAGDYTGYLVNRSGDTAARAIFGYMGDQQAVGFALGPGTSGRDIYVYRAAANILALAEGDRLRIFNAGTTEVALDVLLTGDVSTRWRVLASGLTQWSDGTNAHDVTMYRIGTRQVRIDSDGANAGLDRIHLQGRVSFGSLISPAALTANTNDWNPTGLATASIIRISTDATPRTLSGIVAGNAGDILWLTNINTATAITLAHDVTSTAANRFFCPNNANYTLNPRASVQLFYDNTSARWRVLGGT